MALIEIDGHLPINSMVDLSMANEAVIPNRGRPDPIFMEILSAYNGLMTIPDMGETMRNI
jgi:hypothetical protein